MGREGKALAQITRLGRFLISTPANMEGHKGLRPYLNRFIPGGQKELLPGNSRRVEAGGESDRLGERSVEALAPVVGKVDFTFPSSKLAHAG